MLSRKDLIKTVAEREVINFFVLMLNPRFRGPNFNFKTFDIESHVKACLNIYFIDKPLTRKEQEMAANTVKHEWMFLLHRSGILEFEASVYWSTIN